MATTRKTRKPRPLSTAMMRTLVRLLDGPVAFRYGNSVRALLRRGMLEQLADGRVALSHWGRINALKVRTHPQVAGWVPGAIKGGC